MKCIKLIGILVCSTVFQTRAATTLFENFENGWNGWSTDNGLWEIGRPSIGPLGGHNSSNCATPSLDTSAPASTSSTLISPLLELPQVSGEEHIEIRFWESYSYGGCGCGEGGYVQLSAWSDAGWGPWINLGLYAPPQASDGWHPVSVDITAYAGQKLRIGFTHTNAYVSMPGWYLDDVEIWHGVPTWDGSRTTFEEGWDNWYTDYGIWDIGHPGMGPEGGYNSSGCATPSLETSAPANANSTLISPLVNLPVVWDNEHIEIRFRQWYAYGGCGCGEGGYVQLSAWENSTWGPWINLGLYAPPQPSNGWHPVSVDITLYAGRKVRIGFTHTNAYVSMPGWYLDDVEIWHGVPTWDGSRETFEEGWGNWYTDYGIWDLGNPATGPQSGYDSNSCAAISLETLFLPYTISRLISPLIELPEVSGEEHLEARFRQWYSYGGCGCGEGGYIQISEWSENGWGPWIDRGQYVPAATSDGWYPAAADLTPYSGMQVRLGFCHVGKNYSTPGWYLDDVEIIRGLTTHMGNFTWDDKIDLEDLALFTSQWLTSYKLCDIAPPPSGDWSVNLEDFAAIARNWLEGTTL